MANEAIRQAAKGAGLKLWEVAEIVGVTDSTFSKMLRRELTEERQQAILAEIKHLAAEKEAAHGSNAEARDLRG